MATNSDLVGKKVRRGPDWRWGNQDGGNKVGTIRSNRSSTAPGWVEVLWPGNSTPLQYRMGAEQCYDLVILEDLVGSTTIDPTTRELQACLEAGHFDRAARLVYTNTQTLFGVLLSPGPLRPTIPDNVKQAAELLKTIPTHHTQEMLAKLLACFIPEAGQLLDLITPPPAVCKGMLEKDHLRSPGVLLKSKFLGLVFYAKANSIGGLTLKDSGNYQLDLDTTTIPTPEEVKAFLVLRRDLILEDLK